MAILIDTNGRCTERQYFLAVKELPWIKAGRVVVVFTNGSPVDAVRDAARRKEDSDFDEAWVVCDVDNFDVPKANLEAREKGVSIAWSNPCFEVWLILHHDGHTAYLENARKAGQRLGQLLGKPWDKSTFDFSQFDGRIADAMERATLLGPVPDSNPSTGVPLLIAALGHST